MRQSVLFVGFFLVLHELVELVRELCSKHFLDKPCSKPWHFHMRQLDRRSYLSDHAL